MQLVKNVVYMTTKNKQSQQRSLTTGKNLVDFLDADETYYQQRSV